MVCVIVINFSNWLWNILLYHFFFSKLENEKKLVFPVKLFSNGELSLTMLLFICRINVIVVILWFLYKDTYNEMIRSLDTWEVLNIFSLARGFVLWLIE